MADIRLDLTGNAKDPLRNAIAPRGGTPVEGDQAAANASSVNEVVERLRRELRRRRGAPPGVAANSAASVPEEDRLPRWQSVAGQTWGKEDIEDVAAYLNRRFYDVPCPLPGCKAGTVG